MLSWLDVLCLSSAPKLEPNLMDVLGIPLRDVNATHLDQLVTENVHEDHRLEFKRVLPQATMEDRVEFMKDVSSFANSRGGAILYGIASKNGAATAVLGLGAIDTDKEILRLEQTLQSGVRSRIEGISMLPITHPNGVILAVAMPRSLMAPHMVWANETGQFWGRNNAGKFLMDVTQVRQAMLAANEWERAAARFRDTRIERTRTGVGVRGIPEGGTILIHLLPLGGPRDRVDLPRTKPNWATDLYQGGTTGDFVARPNSEGWMVSSDGGRRHIQVFRDGGGVEMRFDLLTFREMNPAATGQRLNGVAIEFNASKWIKMAFLWLLSASVEPPFALFLSMLNVEKTQFTNNNPATQYLDSAYEIDVPSVLVSEQLLDQIPTDIPGALAPTFDAMWQAAGWPRSASRDDKNVVQFAAALNGVVWP